MIVMAPYALALQNLGFRVWLEFRVGWNLGIRVQINRHADQQGSTQASQEKHTLENWRNAHADNDP